MRVTFSVAAEKKLRKQLQVAADFCRYCIETGTIDIQRRATRALAEIEGGEEEKK